MLDVSGSEGTGSSVVPIPQLHRVARRSIKKENGSWSQRSKIRYLRLWKKAQSGPRKRESEEWRIS